ncbi:hypothetical protein DEJ50_04280 [Streptomyces venezuelae]|uniref:Uncharacterized protein n=1 Tax=Streptomyces venezuelae TaxID=54571 RepID=A0A5P2CWE9_STRVZ|nr:hypothetical protein [Streptomyces venezuelae]QES47175.1 hypothetical protein DEJ50_04280 [Streptomyces venezuelae]
MSSQAIAYQGDTPVAARQDQLDAWIVQSTGQGGYATEGPCPACGHHTAQTVSPQAPIEAESTAEALPPERRTTRQFRCACPVEHPARPSAATTGCGRWWLAAVEPWGDGAGPGAGWRLSAQVDPLVGRAAAELSAAAAVELSSARAVAEKWLPGLAALYGLFAIAGTVAGKDAVAHLSTGARVAVFLVFAAGTLLAALSIAAGYRAAFGWLRVGKGDDVGTDEKLLAWYQAKRNQAVGSIGARLRTALLTALGSLVCLIVALGIVWLGPAGTP